MDQRRVNRKKGTTTTYRTQVEGNAVRQLYEVPQHHERAARPVEVRRRNRKPERTTLSIPYSIFLAAACVLTLLLGSYYLQQQALATSSQKKIATLEGTLAEKKKENADELNRIETSINLEEIRDVAINELGMVYATQDNVVLFENIGENYVSQYEEVPQEEESLVQSIIKSK